MNYTYIPCAFQCDWQSSHWEVGFLFPPFVSGDGLITISTNRIWWRRRSVTSEAGSQKGCSFCLALHLWDARPQNQPPSCEEAQITQWNQMERNWGPINSEHQLPDMWAVVFQLPASKSWAEASNNGEHKQAIPALLALNSRPPESVCIVSSSFMWLCHSAREHSPMSLQCLI